MKEKSKFSSEAMMCLTFVRHLPREWTAYPETGGYDLLLARKNDGVQVGIEAKLTLNAKVICQIREDYWDVDKPNPDFRAILIPHGAAGSLAPICSMLGITVIEQMDKATFEASSYWRRESFHPQLPRIGDIYWGSQEEWYDWAPLSRIELPDYVPDVVAGHSAPVKLTPWKIKALKIAILVETRGYVTRADFKAIQIDHRRWLDPWVKWLQQGEKRGTYVAGPRLGDFKAQHPKNYEEIKADIDKWRPKDEVI